MINVGLWVTPETVQLSPRDLPQEESEQNWLSDYTQHAECWLVM